MPQCNAFWKYSQMHSLWQISSLKCTNKENVFTESLLTMASAVYLDQSRLNFNNWTMCTHTLWLSFTPRTLEPNVALVPAHTLFSEHRSDRQWLDFSLLPATTPTLTSPPFQCKFTIWQLDSQGIHFQPFIILQNMQTKITYNVKINLHDVLSSQCYLDIATCALTGRLIRPHCEWWLYILEAAVKRRLRSLTKYLFQVCSLLKEHGNSPVTMPQGGKCHCQGRHPLPLVVFPSGVPSWPSATPEPRDVPRHRAPSPSFPSLPFLRCCTSRIERLVMVSDKKHLSLWPRLSGWEQATIRGKKHGICFQISAVFTVCSAIILCRNAHQRIM